LGHRRHRSAVTVASGVGPGPSAEVLPAGDAAGAADGAALGSVFGGKFADYFGRRKYLLFLSFVFLIGALLSAAAPDI
ncbi:MFS transporter, partial [Mycobacterium tuberculosis]|nr:MFS transporter [Mycobacterium tuberculosis]